MSNIHVLFDTHNYKENEDEYLFYDELEVVKSYIKSISKAKNGHKLTRFALLSNRSSHYGSIGNNGAVGYKLVDSVDGLFFGSWDDLKLTYDDQDNSYTIIYYDHDGSSNARFAPVSKSKYEELESMTHSHEAMVKSIRKCIEQFKPKMLLHQVNTADSQESSYSL